ncbi:MAG TPA: DUF1127 domain-containing protein [Stellaceae bacterium]|nr:DUF1127 domain-containing protein [Stellaceae bacterium]
MSCSTGFALIACTHERLGGCRHLPWHRQVCRCPACRAVLLRSLPRSVRLCARRARRLAKCWAERWRTRRLLARLDERQLKDVGLNRLEAAREARKPFWRR